MKSFSVALVTLCAACGGGGPSFPENHPRIYLGPNADRLKAALAAKTPAAKAWLASVERWTDGQDVYNFGAWNAALAYQLTGEEKYCNAAVDAVDKVVSDANSAIAGGGKPQFSSDDYLAIGETVGDISLVYDWCYPVMSGAQRATWGKLAQQGIWNVWNPMDAEWGGRATEWAGWAIDDPSDNYYYSFLRATMLFGLAAHGEIDGADDWLTMFRTTKLQEQLVPEFDEQLQGGGSREGTGYGVSMRTLFDLYDVWNASTGEEIATLTDHTRASMISFMHQTLPTLDRVAPTGDQSRDSTASFFDYHRGYLEELIYQFPDDPQAGRAKQLLADSSVPEMTQHFMEAFDMLLDTPDVDAQPLDGLGTAYYAPGIGQLYARSGWDKHATWVNLIAGAYTQSHAHQDQGAIMIYKDGWLAYDPVVESHSGLRPEVEAHSTVRIVDGGSTVGQKLGTQSKLVALHQGDGWLHAAADLTPAFKGNDAISKFERELVYLEPDCIVVYDRVSSRSGGQQVWQLSVPASPTTSGTRSTVSAAGHTLTIERAVSPSGTSASVHSFASDSDYAGGYRLDEAAPAGDNRFLHVIWIDNSVGSVVAGADSATITAGNHTYIVSFDHDAVGGSLSIDGDSHELGTGIDSLPE